MKKLLLLICVITASVFTTFASKTIYVAPSSAGTASGLDADNPMTFPQALGALDATGYTTLVLPNAALFHLTGGTNGYGRIPIVDNSKIIIEGNNSILEGDGGETRIIRASTGCRVQLRNLTLRLGNGAASLGGAIFFGGDSLTINGCIFESNTADNGAAIGCRGKYVKITNTWFKDNYLRNSYQGGAISHTGTTSGGTLIVENSTFSNNIGKAANNAWGTAIITAFDGTTRNYLNTISVSNCTFYKNNAGLNTNAGNTTIQLDFLGTTAPTGVVTTATFVNNTFYGNSNCGIRVWGKQQAVSLINNVIVGDSWANVSGTSVQDHGIITEFSVAEGRPAIIAKNNYIVAKNPKSTKIDDVAFANGNSDNNILVTTISQNEIDALALSATIQMPVTGVPYLSITNSSSSLVEGGINTVAGITLPETDVRGITRGYNAGGSGVKSDIGAYEVNTLPFIVTGLSDQRNNIFTISQSSNEILISSIGNNNLSVKVYSMNGQFVFAQKGTDVAIERNTLQKGLYIVSINDGVRTVVKKIIL